ncbi:MAG: sigma-70 family RNA polymerase sigma factor [Saprospiraceae bacterium]|nr:sigma-70 family RNA polymerase sigma factor [Saprospiraceae bacterium]
MTDEEIIQLIQDEKQEGMVALYDDAFNLVRTLVIRNSGSSEDAEDLFQEVLVVLVKQIRKGSFELKGKLTTYIYAVASKQWLYILRQRKGKEAVSLDDGKTVALEGWAEEDLAEKTEYEEKHTLIAEKLKQLNEECQKIIQWFYYNKIPLLEIGKKLKYTEGSIRVKKNRCMNYLKKLVLGESK